MPPELAASALLGHRRGAFSGAQHSHEGHCAQAHGGTLFLDETGEATPQVQAMLLRAIETGRMSELGLG